MSHHGSFLCDDQCLSYKSMRICSHIMALAIKQNCLTNLLKWYCTMKHIPNFTILAESGKPSTAGKKANAKGDYYKAHRTNPKYNSPYRRGKSRMAHTRRITTSSVDSATPYLQTMCEPHPPVASNSLQLSLAFCVDNSSPQYMYTYNQGFTNYVY